MSGCRDAQQGLPEPSFGRLLDYKESGRRLGVSHWKVRRMVSEGILESVQLGTRVLIPLRALEDLVSRNTRPASDE